MDEERGVRGHWLPRVAGHVHRYMTWLQRRSPLILMLLVTLTLVMSALAPEVRDIEPRSLLHRLYLGVQVLVFNWSTDPEPEPASLLLWIGRLSALSAALVGAVEFAARLFDVALRERWIAMAYKGHVVVCGLESEGSSLCAALIESGCLVVAIHPEPGSPSVSRARRRGVLVHIGDPLDPDVLEAVNIDQAAWVVAFHSGGAIASVASETLGDRASPLRFLMDRSSQTIEPQPVLASEHRYSSEFFQAIRVDLHDRAASFLIGDVGVFQHVFGRQTLSELESAPIASRNVLVAGDGVMAERLLGSLAWEAGVVFTPVAMRPALELAFAHPRAGIITETLASTIAKRVQHEGEIPSFTSHSFERPLDGNVLDDTFLFSADLERAAFDYVFVCCVSNEQTLVVAESIARRFTERRLSYNPVVVAVFEEFEEGESVPPSLRKLRFGPRELKDPIEGASGGRQLLYIYDCWKRTLTAQRLFASSPVWCDHWGIESVDRMAVRAHALYENRNREVPLTMDEAWEQWRLLADELKESNRQFVRDIDRKLAMVGRRRIRAELDATEGTFTEVEIECLARAEHERWLIERWERGWSQGMTRDVASKISTNLKPWHELDPMTQEIDRHMIRGLGPAILVPEGFRIERV